MKFQTEIENQKSYAEECYEEWKPVLEANTEPLSDEKQKLVVTACLLENQRNNLAEAVTNVTGGVDQWDGILISMIRRSVPKLIEHEIFGVQPMKTPTSLVFSISSHYVDENGDPRDEAGFDEPDSGFSGMRTDMTSLDSAPAYEGRGTPDGTLTDPLDVDYGYGVGMPVATAEMLGDTTVWNEMALKITKHSVTAKSRALRTSWSVELAQDMEKVHGLSAFRELSHILAQEMTSEQNREMVRRAYVLAKQGALDCSIPGYFDLNTDSDGRWAVEKFKGLMFQLEKEANRIAIETRRGKGNFIVCSANVASAFAIAGLLDTGSPKHSYVTNPGTVDSSTVAVVGKMKNGTKIIVDAYATGDFVLIGYKGNQMDASAYSTPYIPLTLFQSIKEESFSPTIGFKSRGGFIENPHSGSGGAGNSTYLRLFGVQNL